VAFSDSSDEEDYSQKDELFSENEDDENEAWVYKNLRGGEAESVKVTAKKKGKGKSGAGGDDSLMTDGNDPSMDDGPEGDSHSPKTMAMLNPASRQTDAVLNCPCCFTTVCMDCQRHDKYVTQFRAMFVMNIQVDWSRKLIDSEGGDEGQLKKDEEDGGEGDAKRFKEHQVMTPSPPPTISPTSATMDTDDYYQVSCLSCSTKVAVLNMSDEIYHFYDCLESR
jgi:hypothetical protein